MPIGRSHSTVGDQMATLEDNKWGRPLYEHGPWIRRFKIGFTFLALAIVIGLGLQGIQIRQNTRALDAICALKHDLEQRVSNSQQFLIEHPNGIPGIKAQLIKDNIAQQKRTIDILQRKLKDSCPPLSQEILHVR